jgi:acyl-CoA thioester hydrolase
MKIRVYYKDTDCGGIVYHSRYLDFCEMTRSELFFSHGKSPTQNGCHFAIKNIEANFVKPAYLGDLLNVTTKILKIKHTSFTLFHQIFRNEILVFEMKITLVNLCQDGKPHQIDQETKDFFREFLSF